MRILGEDRWLCTLLIKRGYKLAYSASSYAYTRCPETFDEFYNQRRRWTLSIISNTLDLLWNSRQTVKLNPNFSWIYIIFQVDNLFLSYNNVRITTMCLQGLVTRHGPLVSRIDFHCVGEHIGTHLFLGQMD